MQSTTEWAKEHGSEFRWHCDLDNYEPVARNVAYGIGWTYDLDDSRRGIVLDDVSELKDARSALYLIDDGRTVRTFYVVAWHPEGKHIIIQPMPTNFDADGAPILRGDGRGQVDYYNWTLGPRRAYHLKVVAS